MLPRRRWTAAFPHQNASDAAFIDTTVINWLVSAKRMLEASSNGALDIVEGPPDSFAARLFDLLGLSDVLARYATRQDALAQRRAPAPLLGLG